MDVTVFQQNLIYIKQWQAGFGPQAIVYRGVGQKGKRRGDTVRRLVITFMLGSRGRKLQNLIFGERQPSFLGQS